MIVYSNCLIFLDDSVFSLLQVTSYMIRTRFTLEDGRTVYLLFV